MKYVALVAFMLCMGIASAASMYSNSDAEVDYYNSTVVSAHLDSRVQANSYPNDSDKDYYYDQRGMVIIDNGVELEDNHLTMNSEVQLSNGHYVVIKISPATAIAKAESEMDIKSCDRYTGCTVTLKERGIGDNKRLVYEVEAKKPAKFWGFVRTNMTVSTDVNAESGEVDASSRSWWAFMATTN